MFKKHRMTDERKQKLIKISMAVGFVVLTLSVTLIMFLLMGDSEKPIVQDGVQESNSGAVQQGLNTPDVQIGIPERGDIDFTNLKGVNADTVGYISVPNTVIDYPVVRGVDNAKYLTTAIDGSYDAYGTVFSDMFNNDTLTDPVTVLYGHFTPEETFFTQLHNYADKDYFEQHPDMYLYTPTASYRYEIVAAFINDNLNILYEKDYTDETQMQGFIDHMANIPDTTANLNLENVSTDDTFLVLSTCMNATYSVDNRYVVVGKLVENAGAQVPDAA